MGACHCQAPRLLKPWTQRRRPGRSAGHGRNPGVDAIAAVLATSFLASCVEAIEMVAIVVGVGATRGWPSTAAGAAAGFAGIAVVAVAFGAALSVFPIDALRLVVGGFLLVFGLHWLRNGVRRVAGRGLAGYRHREQVDTSAETGLAGIDWTAFLLAFKGVLLEGLEIAFIVVSFGANYHHPWLAAASGVAAVVFVGGIAAAARGAINSIPRSLLQLVVGVLLTTFGTFWSAEGLGVEWPGSDASLLWILCLNGALAAAFIWLARRQALGLTPEP